jgi:hypothetical protein
MGVAETYHVLVQAVRALEHHHPEVPHTVGSDAVGLPHDLMAKVAKGVPDGINQPVVGDGDVRPGGLGCFDLAEAIEVDRFSAAV